MPSIGMQQLIYGSLFLIFAWHLARALIRGAWQAGAVTYDRRDQPIEYWFYLLFYVAMLLLSGWLSLVGEDSDTSLAGHIGIPLLIGVATAFWLVRALQTGSAGPTGMIVDRREQPWRFWLLILCHIAIIGLACGIFSWRPQPRPRTFYDEVGPVLAAVRAQLPGPAAAEFYNVRVDSASRLICGEVKRPNGKMLRFFGTGGDQRAEATLESDALPNFTASYARLCGGRPILP
jgi:hypothetical protein